MAHFTTRVELHDAAEENYQTLHAEMEELGFTSTIEGHDGATYKLPNAEYNYEGEVPIDTVLDKAKYAADTTGLKYENPSIRIPKTQMAWASEAVARAKEAIELRRNGFRSMPFRGHVSLGPYSLWLCALD